MTASSQDNLISKQEVQDAAPEPGLEAASKFFGIEDEVIGD